MTASTDYDPNRIAELLRVQGRTQDWLADITGYDRATVSRVLNGHQPLSGKFAAASARVLGVPLSWLEVSGVAA